MSASPFDGLLPGAPPPRQVSPPATGIVTRSDISGVWVTPLGDDTRSPVGPCRGGHPDGPEQPGLPEDTIVLLVWTDGGPWIARHDPASTPSS